MSLMKGTSKTGGGVAVWDGWAQLGVNRSVVLHIWREKFWFSASCVLMAIGGRGMGWLCRPTLDEKVGHPRQFHPPPHHHPGWKWRVCRSTVSRRRVSVCCHFRPSVHTQSVVNVTQLKPVASFTRVFLCEWSQSVFLNFWVESLKKWRDGCAVHFLKVGGEKKNKIKIFFADWFGRNLKHLI